MEEKKESKKEKASHIKQEQYSAKKIDVKQEVKYEGKRIVRVMSTDIDGSLSLERALRKIKGIDFMFARSVCLAMNFDRKKRIGTMSDSELKMLEDFIRQPKLPSWMLNRRKDPETGGDNHLTMSQLDLKRKEDINLMKRMRSYKGIRHELGQPVRGQRTRSTFRVNKTVGVMKKKSTPAKAGTTKQEAKK